MMTSASAVSIAASSANHCIGRWLNSEAVVLETNGEMTGSGDRIGSFAVTGAGCAVTGCGAAAAAAPPLLMPATPLATAAAGAAPPPLIPDLPLLVEPPAVG